MKKIILFASLFVLAIVIKSQGQSPSLISNEINSDEYFIKYLLRNGDGHIILEKRNFDFYLKKLSNNLELTNKVKVDPIYEKASLTTEDIFILKDKIILFSSFKNQKLKKHFFFIQTIRPSDFSLNNDLKKVLEVGYDNKYNEGSHGFCISSDSTKLLVYTAHSTNKNENKKISLNILDLSLNSIRQKEVNLRFKSNFFKEDKFIISNEGNIFFSGYEYTQKTPNFFFPQPVHNYHLFYLPFTSDSLAELTLKNEDKKLCNMNFYLDKNKIIGGGHFNFSNEPKYVEGSLSVQLELSSKQIVKEKYFSLDDSIQSFKGPSVKFHKAIFNPINKCFYMLAEHQFDYNPGRNIGEASNANTTYGNILVQKFSFNGEKEWEKVIIKKQKTPPYLGRHSSFFSTLINNNLWLFFNDNSDNYFKKGKKQEFQYNYEGAWGVLAQVELKKNGEYERKPVFDKPNENEKESKNRIRITYPNKSFLLSPTEIFFYEQLGGKTNIYHILKIN